MEQIKTALINIESGTFFFSYDLNASCLSLKHFIEHVFRGRVNISARWKINW
jgi:hypothetical protein